MHESAVVDVSMLCRDTSTVIRSSVSEPLTVDYVLNDTTNNKFQFSPFTCAHEQCCQDITYTYSVANTLDDPPAFNEDYISQPIFDGNKYISLVDTTQLSDNVFWIHARNNYDGSSAISPKIKLNIVAEPEPDDTPTMVALILCIVLGVVVLVGASIIVYKKCCVKVPGEGTVTPGERLGSARS